MGERYFREIIGKTLCCVLGGVVEFKIWDLGDTENLVEILRVVSESNMFLVEVFGIY